MSLTADRWSNRESLDTDGGQTAIGNCKLTAERNFSIPAHHHRSVLLANFLIDSQCLPSSAIDTGRLTGVVADF